LEGSFEVILVNAQHIKAVPGRKTDQKDSEWIADLLQHGLLRSSFVPPTPTRELRDLTRYRVNLVQVCNRIANRIQKVLEDSNIKLAAVASDSLGASGRAMLKAIIQGEQDAEKLSEMSKGTLRNKRDELKLALEGRITAHHRFLLKELFDHLEFVEGKIERLEAEISQRMHPFEEKVQHLRKRLQPKFPKTAQNVEQPLGFSPVLIAGLAVRDCRQEADAKAHKLDRGKYDEQAHGPRYG
jgi:transposase